MGRCRFGRPQTAQIVRVSRQYNFQKTHLSRDDEADRVDSIVRDLSIWAQNISTKLISLALTDLVSSSNFMLSHVQTSSRQESHASLWFSRLVLRQIEQVVLFVFVISDVAITVEHLIESASAGK